MCQRIMIKFKPKDLTDYLKNLIPDSNFPHDFTNRKDKDIIEYFRKVIVDNDKGVDREKKFYGGITNDIDKNLARHNIKSYLGCVSVDSYETAKRIEGLLHSELGVFIGKNEEGSAGRGGNDGEEDPDKESRIVYLADRLSSGFRD